MMKHSREQFKSLAASGKPEEPRAPIMHASLVALVRELGIYSCVESSALAVREGVAAMMHESTL